MTIARLHWAIMLFTVWLGLTACAGNQQAFRTDSGARQLSLDLWLDKTLIPYLIQQLDQHPRFRSQPVLLVRMQGDNVLPQIDDLTWQIRQRITDAMLKQPGLDLAWRPSSSDWQHPQSLDDIPCGEYDEVNYYIGIDCGLSRNGQQLHVKVRALNLAENKWVSGFGRSWHGTPTREQIDALERLHVDEHLRGRRPLPFSSQQPDMLAAYLARNLSCLLQQGQSEVPVVYVSRPDENLPETFKTALDIVGRYLARFKEVEVTDKPSRANVTIVATIHAIDRRLHQVWISARQRRGDIYLPGAGTEAYVDLEAADNRPPEIARREADRASSLPLTPDRANTEQFPIISTFDLVTPLDPLRCDYRMDWQSGIRRVTSNQTLMSGSCLAVEVRTSVPAYIFLVGQDARGELSQVFPNDCATPGSRLPWLHPGGRFRFPADYDSASGILQLAGPPGTERIYAIAITAAGLAGRFEDRMKPVQGICESGDGYPAILQSGGLRRPHERIDRWQNYLSWLSDNHPGMMDWREIRFRHGGM